MWGRGVARLLFVELVCCNDAGRFVAVSKSIH